MRNYGEANPLRNFLSDLAMRRANWLHICASLSIGTHRERIARKSVWWCDVATVISGQARWRDLRAPTEYF